MAERVYKVLIVLANPYSQTDIRANVVQDLCKSFAESCQKNNLEVDLLDLYKDPEFDPVHEIDEKDTKVLEYQIRIRKAQLVVFFHPVWWLSVPAILKGFLDKVLVSGFGYRLQNKLPQGLLDEKRAIVVAVSEKPVWQLKYLYGNVLQNFWQKGVLDYCGIPSRMMVFGNFRSVSENQIEVWKKQMESLAVKFNPKENFLDLF